VGDLVGATPQRLRMQRPGTLLLGEIAQRLAVADRAMLGLRRHATDYRTCADPSPVAEAAQVIRVRPAAWRAQPGKRGPTARAPRVSGSKKLRGASAMRPPRDASPCCHAVPLRVSRGERAAFRLRSAAPRCALCLPLDVRACRAPSCDSPAARACAASSRRRGPERAARERRQAPAGPASEAHRARSAGITSRPIASIQRQPSSQPVLTERGGIVHQVETEFGEQPGTRFRTRPSYHGTPLPHSRASEVSAEPGQAQSMRRTVKRSRRHPSRRI
jgi:hypothetical protein